MKEAGMELIETYIAHFQNKTAQYIVTSLILELYLVPERLSGEQSTKKW